MVYKPKSRAEIARNMGAIRSTNNRTETALRKRLHGMGLRYRKYVPGLKGKPDIVFTKSQVAVFVDGDYWHGREILEGGWEKFINRIQTPNKEYWIQKMQRNIERDQIVTNSLKEAGWTVVRLWESDVKRNIDGAARMIAELVRTGK
jgi:DNA mismatch endonuclease, patch repair protein